MTAYLTKAAKKHMTHEEGIVDVSRCETQFKSG